MFCNILFLLFLLFLFTSRGFATYKITILETPILHFFPRLKLHHVVIIEDEESGSIEAVDFTPLDQRNLKTIGKLFLGLNVPAEIRILTILKKDITNTKSLIEQWENASLEKIGSRNKKIENLLKEWKNDSMNLYCHNCQHFSRFVKRNLSK